MKSEEIVHFGCPGGAEQPPAFKRTSVIKLHTGDIETWECPDCGSVIMITRPTED